MIEEQNLSYETAQLLAKYGFDDWSDCLTLNYEDHTTYDTCTQAIALAWLRKEKNVFIDICTLSPMVYSFRVALVSDTTGHLYEDYACEEGERFMNYEDAVDAALSYVLENLLNEEE